MARRKSKPPYESTKLYDRDYEAVSRIADGLGVHRIQVLAAACRLLTQLDPVEQVAAIQDADRQRMLPQEPAHAA